jgi:DNA-binding transcriptional LysR family regulator
MMASARDLVGPDGETQTLRYAARIDVDSVDAMYRMTREGLGLSSPPDYLVDADLDRGDLVEPLPDWTVSPMPVHAVWPPNLPRTGAASALIDVLRAAERD